VIVRLLQNKFDGTKRYAKTELDELTGEIARETGLATDKVAHVANRLASTHFKRQWPRVVTREEAGLPDIGDLGIV
jgi:hypothetical protein